MMNERETYNILLIKVWIKGYLEGRWGSCFPSSFFPLTAKFWFCEH